MAYSGRRWTRHAGTRMVVGAIAEPANPTGSRTQSLVAVALMLGGVVAVYCPPSLLAGDGALYGMDFWTLHVRRLTFAREHLSWFPWSLPGWYPQELLGTPFWSNLQSFPWIPTRLVLLLVDPIAAFALGVNLAATLSALFTYLYGRSIGWSRAAAALAGWTFACSGFFAARVMVGHLPLLEAYPALPLLLWLLERARSRRERPRALAALALGTACSVVAGHPQLPAYAVGAALIYLVWTGTPGRRLRSALAMGLGAGVTLVVWWPMLELLGRSTRVLGLADPRNDIALPYSRLGALVLPWRDGWPSAVVRSPPVAFTDYPSSAYFWDTFAYLGIVPWLAALGLGVALLHRRRWPARRGAFFAALGAGALVLALPLGQWLGSFVPGTLLRSPARSLYLTTFCLALATGAAFEACRRRPGRAVPWIAGAAAALHVIDLAAHDRPFIKIRSPALDALPAVESLLVENLGDSRVAIDYNLPLDFNRRFEDVGFFDSIMLARPYRALLALDDAPEDSNLQALPGSALSARALSSLGVSYVVTPRVRSDLPLVLSTRYHLYTVPVSTRRVSYYPRSRVHFMDEAAMLERMREDDFHLVKELMLPVEVRPEFEPGGEIPPAGRHDLEYLRPSPDRIELRIDVPQAGFVRILESWDPGWRASVDGVASPLLRADTFAMAVAVDAGRHRVVLDFVTPGARLGVILSLSSLALLGGLLWVSRRSSDSGE